jgi:type I restriction enzyme S subunit
LDTVDEAIVKTEAVFAKLKQVRAGLLHDLLTHGLDEHGKLRDPIAHPEQFQESSLGRIPRKWHISTLGMELPLQRGFDITVAEQQQGEVPVVSSSGITSYHNKAMVAGPGVVTGRKGKLGSVYYVDRPFWPHDTTLWVTDFRGNSEKFAALLLSELRLERFDAATSVPTLNRNFIHPLPIALPSRPEQERLVAVVEAWDECLDRESKWLDKLRDLKTGISTDLLTGRVRVPEEITVAP